MQWKDIVWLQIIVVNKSKQSDRTAVTQPLTCQPCCNSGFMGVAYQRSIWKNVNKIREYK